MAIEHPSYLPPRPPVQPPKRTLAQTIPDLFESNPDQEALFTHILNEYSGLSADTFDPTRIVQFFHLLNATNALPPGDYIELGTYGGLTLKVIHKLMDPQRTLYSLDTFEGFDERDVAVERTKYDYSSELEWFSRPSVENVARYVGDGVPPANLKIIKGWFPESFKGLEQIRWRFVHIDFDLYQPIKTALKMLWGPLLPGGIVVIHDYGCYSFRAARTAVNEFCESIGVLPTEMPDRWGSAVIRKPISSSDPGDTKHIEELVNLRGQLRSQEETWRTEIERVREQAMAERVRQDKEMTMLAQQERSNLEEIWRAEVERVREQAAAELARQDEELMVRAQQERSTLEAFWRTEIERVREQAAAEQLRRDDEWRTEAERIRHETVREMGIDRRAQRLLREIARQIGLGSS